MKIILSLLTLLVFTGFAFADETPTPTSTPASGKEFAPVYSGHKIIKKKKIIGKKIFKKWIFTILNEGLSGTNAVSFEIFLQTD
ncbi:MAG: hypothetical protein WC004_02700 [Candidatus Absconditabacterales bacterium]